MVKFPLEKAAAFFASGYVFGGVIVTVIAGMHDESWLGGLAVAGLSFPIGIIYFWILWTLRHWRYLQPTSAGMAVAGCLCGLYPAVCGFFPVYWLRWDLALAVATIQFLFLAAVVAVFAWLTKPSNKNAS
jgi:hypothetical protein